MPYTVEDYRREYVLEHLHKLPPEKVFEKFSPEERLRGLPLEDRLRGLGLSEEEVRKIAESIESKKKAK